MNEIKGWEHRDFIIQKYKKNGSMRKTADSVNFELSKLPLSERYTVSAGVVRKILVKMGIKINKPAPKLNSHIYYKGNYK